MSTAFDVRALSSKFRIELDDSLSTADQESIKAHWVDLADDSAGEPDRVIRAGVHDHSDPLDGAPVIRANSPEALAQRITSEVTVGAIRGLRGEALMLHASAVSLDDGRVIGFVGRSGRGKTTAAQALGRVLRLRDRRDAGRAGRRVGRPLPEAALDRLVARCEGHGTSLNARSSRGAGREPPPGGDRAARSATRRRAAVRGTRADHRGVVGTRTADESPFAPSSARSEPSSRPSSPPAAYVGSSTPRRPPSPRWWTNCSG